jgi:hypothetical protein
LLSQRSVRSLAQGQDPANGEERPQTVGFHRRRYELLGDPVRLRSDERRQELGGDNRILPHTDTRGLPQRLGHPDRLEFSQEGHFQHTRYLIQLLSRGVQCFSVRFSKSLLAIAVEVRFCRACYVYYVIGRDVLLLHRCRFFKCYKRDERFKSIRIGAC